MQPQPLIALTDVEASSRWYETLLGCVGDHGGSEYERLKIHGELILQLHRFDVDHHHGPIGDQRDRPYGNGVLLWFETDHFEAAMARIDELKPDIVLGRHRNPNPQHWEVWVRDPDGYVVVIASPDGSAP
jgi:catechol 2,3-dioxygenase-like lactoylglutathione lyase family enzyme